MALSTADKFRLKLAIETEISKARERIKALEETTAPIKPDVAYGRVSRMDAINNKSVNEAALANVRKDLADLEHTLSSLDEADFGSCQRCGQPIWIDRLLAMPGATMCRRCADQ